MVFFTVEKLLLHNSIREIKLRFIPEKLTEETEAFSADCLIQLLQPVSQERLSSDLF